jgi:hypothetical protein
VDDVGVVQVGRGADLALESFANVGIVKAFGADELEGNQPAEVAVAGLEDLAHAALAQPLQQDVAAQDQLLPSALEEEVGLVRGQPVAPKQLAGESLRVWEVGLQGAGHFLLLGRLEEPELAQGVYEGSVGGGGHAGDPDKRLSSGPLSTQRPIVAQTA